MYQKINSFFLGDNRIRSNDARRWINPYIDASDIKGKAVLKFYPFSDFGSIIIRINFK